MDDKSVDKSGLTRQEFLAKTGLLGAGVILGGVAGVAIGDSDTSSKDNKPDKHAQIVPFHGKHQAGIITNAQDRVCFASFDLITNKVEELKSLLKQWTKASARMTRGDTVGAGIASDVNLPPDDTGEAYGLTPANLTITVGFGASLFDKRFGLSDKRPAALVDLPKFIGDEPRADISDGDLCVQACADDPQVAFHAIHNLQKLAHGVAALRWMQLGFGRTSSTSSTQDTPRNLFGFKDGTNNITSDDLEGLKEFVWAHKTDDKEAGAWMHDGSYMVVRRIRMLIETWDRTALNEQERVFGRTKADGAPFGKPNEHSAVKIALLPEGSHVRESSPKTHDGTRILRRGYSYTDGMDPRLGQLDAGLLFIAFQRDPRKQFIPIQQRLAKKDLLNEYIVHTASAVFACPAGVKESSGSYFGQELFSL